MPINSSSGAIDWDEEKKMLQNIRNRFSPDQMELRVDANGAFSAENGIKT